MFWCHHCLRRIVHIDARFVLVTLIRNLTLVLSMLAVAPNEQPDSHSIGLWPVHVRDDRNVGAALA